MSVPVGRLESAQLFTPGRASYVTSSPEGGFELNLTEASVIRGEAAALLFDPEFHTTALYCGGYPGIAQNWPPEHTPRPGHREADLLALPLEGRLIQEGWDVEAISRRLKKQSDSNNSIGDVLESIKQGLLNPNDFNTADGHGLHLVSGALHAIRFRAILTKALDIDPKLIQRARIHDQYGTPATEFREKEYKATALVKEMGAVAVTLQVLRKVRPGEIEDLAKAEEEFNAIALKTVK